MWGDTGRYPPNFKMLWTHSVHSVSKLYVRTLFIYTLNFFYLPEARAEDGGITREYFLYTI